MSSAKITLVGLYSYLMYDDIDLFSELKLPEGIDKDTLVADILQRSSEFEVQYPDTEYMIKSIKYWSSKWYWTFDKWVKAINIKYEPLHNYDRTEQWSDNNVHEDEHKTTNNRQASTSANNNGSVEGSQSEHTTGESTTENTKSAFDSGDYQPYEKVSGESKDDTTLSNHTNSSSSSSSSTTDNFTENHATDGTYTTTHNGRMFGNIGITSSQDMLNQELEVAYFNLYERIADIFISEYCIPIYV